MKALFRKKRIKKNRSVIQDALISPSPAFTAVPSVSKSFSDITGGRYSNQRVVLPSRPSESQGWKSPFPLGPKNSKSASQGNISDTARVSCSKPDVSWDDTFYDNAPLATSSPVLETKGKEPKKKRKKSTFLLKDNYLEKPIVSPQNDIVDRSVARHLDYSIHQTDQPHPQTDYLNHSLNPPGHSLHQTYHPLPRTSLRHRDYSIPIPDSDSDDMLLSPQWDNIPTIRPSSVKKVTLLDSHQSQLSPDDDDDVYVFSQQHPDGSLRYYTASPVHLRFQSHNFRKNYDHSVGYHSEPIHSSHTLHDTLCDYPHVGDHVHHTLCGHGSQDGIDPGTVRGTKINKLNTYTDHAIKSDKLQKELKSLKQLLTENLSREKHRLEKRENTLAHLNERAMKLQKENFKLMSLTRKHAIEKEKWLEVSKHSQAIQLENTKLLEKIKQLKEQLKDMHSHHHAEVHQLNGELQISENELEGVQNKLIRLKQSHVQLRNDFESIMKSLPHQISMKDHQEAMSHMQRLLDNLVMKNESILQSQEARLEFQGKEKQELMSKLKEASVIVKKLEAQNLQIQSFNRNAQNEIKRLRKEIIFLKEREKDLYNNISETVRLAEKTKAENETFYKILYAQNKSAERTATAKAQNDLILSSLERRLESYEDTLDRLNKTSSVSSKKYRKQIKEYEGEVRNLRSVLSRTQDQVKKLTQDKRDADDRLDLMWRTNALGVKLDTLRSDSGINRTVISRSFYHPKFFPPTTPEFNLTSSRLAKSYA